MEEIKLSDSLDLQTNNLYIERGEERERMREISFQLLMLAPIVIATSALLCLYSP